ncbi:hypothetical protein [Solirubrobacter soli]|uniref:hypothetical protein n=1 Tax=Solirubrobacter soli TaxID=363832 RepID=UPI00040EF67F|nr:hypothetical protein [Solirubrobacter soli]
MTRVRILGVAAVAAVLAVTGSSVAQQGSGDPALERSAQLAVAPAPAAGSPIGAEAARSAAAGIARTIPLPPGGTFDGIRWEEAGGVFTADEIALVLQYNATCQWLRAWRDGRNTPATARVLADVPSWPLWRGGDGAAAIAGVVGDVRAGGGADARAMLADCDAAHQREVAYATAKGLTPTR